MVGGAVSLVEFWLRYTPSVCPLRLLDMHSCTRAGVVLCHLGDRSHKAQGICSGYSTGATYTRHVLVSPSIQMMALKYELTMNVNHF